MQHTQSACFFFVTVEVIKREGILPVVGYDQWISGPSCWWLRPSSDGQPLCPGSLEMQLSVPSLSAYYWTGVPDGSRADREVLARDTLLWHSMNTSYSLDGKPLNKYKNSFTEMSWGSPISLKIMSCNLLSSRLSPLLLIWIICPWKSWKKKKQLNLRPEEKSCTNQ